MGIAIALIIAVVAMIVFFVVLQAVLALVMALVIAFLAGLIAQKVVGTARGGPLMTILLGFIGAVVGSLLAHAFNLPLLIRISGLPVVWTIVGAIIVAFLWNLFWRRPPEAAAVARR